METKVEQMPLSHRALGWLDKNRNQAVLGAVVVLIAGILVGFFSWHHEQKQIEAGQALSSVAARQLTVPNASKDPQAYLKVAAEYPNSQAGARALLLAAGDLFTEGKYPEAQAQFERFVREHRDSPLLGEALVGVASSLEAQGKTDQAVSAYKDLIARHPNDSVVPQAKFSLGGLYEIQKRPELARDMYEQVERDSRFSILGSEAGMRLEELSQKNPNLAPAAPVPGMSTTPPVSATPTPPKTAAPTPGTSTVPLISTPAPASTAPQPAGGTTLPGTTAPNNAKTPAPPAQPASK